MSLGTVRRIDRVGIADAELLLAEEARHCLTVERKARCRVVGGTGAGEVESGRVAVV